LAEFVIHGQKPLKGEIEVYGAKNAAIKMIAASILINGPVELSNVPQISDIEKLCLILEKMGAKTKQDDHNLKIDCTHLRNTNPDPFLVRQIRASVVLVGPLLARFGKVFIPHPGGDKIGSRPIDRHLKVFRDLGVEVTEENIGYTFRIGESSKHLASFDKITVTGTENILLFACTLDREIKLSNCAIEPEIIDLIDFLNKAGAKIESENREIIIKKTNKLNSVTHDVLPDRIEAGTFAVLAAANKSPLRILKCNPKHLQSFLSKLAEIGVKFDVGSDFIYIRESSNLKATDIETKEYPGFATDLQPPIGLLLTQVQGVSRIKENLFENRLAYLEELKTMGAQIEIINHREAVITGPCFLHGSEIQSLDIRAGATLIIAGLIAKGVTTIKEAENIDRGYEKIEERLAKIGAKILRNQ